MMSRKIQQLWIEILRGVREVTLNFIGSLIFLGLGCTLIIGGHYLWQTSSPDMLIPMLAAVGLIIALIMNWSLES